MRIGIIGAGHAGIEAAAAAHTAGADVVVFSDEPVAPYFRPRLVSVAMGQTAPEEIALHPPAWYAARGIVLRRDCAVSALQAADHAVTAGGATERFDALVLACGSQPVRPAFARAAAGLPVFNLWTQREALDIRARVRPGARLVVIGGGLLGVECALRAVAVGAVAILVEQQPCLLPGLLSQGAAAALQQQVSAAGVTVRTGCGVASLAASAAGDIAATLDDGAILEADLVLVCIGAAPRLDLARAAGLATARGVLADTCLQVAPGVFVAGDAAQAGRPAQGVVREAVAQGRLAGANAAAWAGGKTLQPFVPVPPQVSLRCGSVKVELARHADDDATGERLRALRPDAG